MKHGAAGAMDAAVVGFVGHERVESLDGRESSGGLNKFRVLRRLPNDGEGTRLLRFAEGHF